jgi:hypothetical protein
MASINMVQSTFKIKRFTSSADKEFVKALKIYNDTIPAETKTSTNEITFFLDLKSSRLRDMYFFGLYYDDEIIGYIECGYLKTTKTLIIDYITLKEKYNYNGIYYPLFSLFQQYFSDNLIDIDYIMTEVSLRSLEENVDMESYYSRKLLGAEDFRIIDIPYPQPKLGLKNLESNMDLRLMIKSIKSISSIKTDTFIMLVQDIYYNHYLDWYKEFLNEEEYKEYESHVNSQFERVKDQLKKVTNIRLSDSPMDLCKYYLSGDCHYNHNNISTAGFTSNAKQKTLKAALALGIIVILIISVVLSLLVYWALIFFNSDLEKFAPLFTAISSTITGLVVLVISYLKK